MRYDFKYKQGARSFRPDFGRVINATDGGYERGHAAGYTEGETAATAAAEAANALILADCNAVLPDKGVEVADTLEQVPQRIGEIEYSPNVLLYTTGTTRMFTRAVFPEGYEITITAPNHQGDMGEMFSGAKGIRKITMDIPTDADYIAYNFIYPNSPVEELVLPDGIHFKDWNYFATLSATLRIVTGRINPSGNTSNVNTFNGCYALEEVYFMPGTIEGSISFGHSANLSAESIQSIIDGLADLTGATAQTLTLHATVKSKLTDEQKATILSKNWNIA